MSTEYIVNNNDNNSTETDSLSKTKATFSSMWNNVKYEIQSKFRVKFNFDSPICLLGQFYHIKMSDSINESDRKSSTLYVYEKFKHDFFSRIWITYRKEFPAILETNITSDTGWGCMIRSGQMILAQALLVHFLGRNWRWIGPQSEQDESVHRMILRWFIDSPNSLICPFSIHQFVKFGQKTGKKPGDWFGPASISHIIKNAIEKSSKENEHLKDICCYVAQDCTVFLQDVVDLCSRQPDSWCPVLILVPVRLGCERLNPLYASTIKDIFSWSSCIGLIGGRPRHSLYFIGFQDDKLIYIDPHYCQRTVDATDPNFPLDSFHCLTPRKVSLLSIDPSCSFGFFIQSKSQLDDFVHCVTDLLESTRKAGDYPIFVLNPGKDAQNEVEPDMPERLLRMKYRLVDSKGNVQKVINAEEFVLL